MLNKIKTKCATQFMSTFDKEMYQKLGENKTLNMRYLVAGGELKKTLDLNEARQEFQNVDKEYVKLSKARGKGINKTQDNFNSESS